jgi:hypothetical protein
VNVKTTTKRSMDTAEERKGEELPISTFFNENEKEIKMDEQTTDETNESDFPVFDAVPK